MADLPLHTDVEKERDGGQRTPWLYPKSFWNARLRNIDKVAGRVTHFSPADKCVASSL
jgi:hypothetical protein